MTQESYERAIVLKSELRDLIDIRRKIERIKRNRKEHGICKQFWDDILDLMWDDQDRKEMTDLILFGKLDILEQDILSRTEQLEKEFDQL